ncbi:MAG: membrane-bound serine protease (ClpP class) [Bacteriovoracaceae bacterium]|jgi:membrane-bound serine protease (ClpP class)
MFLKSLLLLPLISLFVLSFAEAEEIPTTLNVDKVLTLTIESTINPATLNYIKTGFKRAASEKFDLINIEINTPGGLVSTTKDILSEFGKSEIPVVVWVKPEGASATSAGAIIASGAHLLFMSDGTNIGAATPINSDGDIKSKDVRKKAINDLVALIQSLSESKGRNAKQFGSMIEEASSFKAKEAKLKNLANAIVNNRREFKEAIDGQVVKIKGKQFKIKANSLEWKEQKWDMGQELLNIFSNPSLAYILFLIGASLIYLELQAPGGLIAGSIGAVCLVIAAIGFQVLPLNLGALGLIVLSFVLFVIEIYITSYGLISIAGILSLIFGSMFLYRTDNSYLSLSTSLIASTVAGIGGFIIFVGWYIYKDHKNIGSGHFNELKGKKALIVEAIDSRGEGYLYSVKVGGEFWKATSSTELDLNGHYEIKGQDKEKMLLLI